MESRLVSNHIGMSAAASSQSTATAIVTATAVVQLLQTLDV